MQLLHKYVVEYDVVETSIEFIGQMLANFASFVVSYFWIAFDLYFKASLSLKNMALMGLPFQNYLDNW